MRKLILTLLIIFVYIDLFAQNSFTFSGEIEDASGYYARLTYLNNQKKVMVDSCAIKNNEFIFKGNVNGGYLATLEVYLPPYQAKMITDANSVHVFLQQGNISGVGHYDHLKDLVISGSKSNDEYRSLRASLDEMNKELEPISNNFNRIARELNAAKKQNKGERIIDSLDKQLTAAHKFIEPFTVRYEAIVHQFVITHPNSFVTPGEMKVYVPSWPLDSVKLIFNKLSPAVQNTFDGKIIKKKIADIIANSEHTVAKSSARLI